MTVSFKASGVLKKTAAIFASAAMVAGYGTAQAENVQKNPLPDFIHQKLAQGVRGIIAGEMHDSVYWAKAIGQSLKSFKKDGGTTVYFEYLQNDRQEIFDKAATGDEDSQRDIRTSFEYGWGSQGSHESAQIRYNLMLLARKTGLRVIGMDTSQIDLHKDHIFEGKSPGSVSAERLEFADPKMEDVIRKNDDGKPFMVIVGQAHTYAGKNANSVFPEIESFFKRSDKGGLDQRLKDAGIPMVSLDMQYSETPGMITKGDGFTEDYIWEIPLQEEMERANPAMVLRGRVITILQKAEDMSAKAALYPNKEANHYASSAAKLKAVLNSCAAEQEISQTIDQVVKDGESLAAKMPQGNERKMIPYLGYRLSQFKETPEKISSVTTLNNKLCEPEAKKIWAPSLD